MTNIKTFTLLELVLVVMIIALMAGVSVPIVKESRSQAVVSKTLALIDTLEDACRRYHFDTGLYATEFSTSEQATEHGLSMNDGASRDWNGPYINKPFSDSDNPFGSGVSMEDDLVDFDLDGDGLADRSGDGNCLLLFNAPTAEAKKVNDQFDSGVPGDWMQTGRVQYIPGGEPGPGCIPPMPGGRLLVYLIGGTGG